MNRFSLLLLASSAAICSSVFADNQPPVANQVSDFTAYAGAPARNIDLLTAFTDPDATSAVRMQTILGNIDVILYGKQTPITVANFLRYVDEGRYFIYDKTLNKAAPSVIHRSVYDPGLKRPFVIQGGAYFGLVSPSDKTSWQNFTLDSVGFTLPPIVNEAGAFSNVTGTIAMARVSGNEDSATSQWFINMGDNSGAPYFLDTAEGGYAVFGRLVGNSLSVAYAISSLPRYDFSSYDPALTSIPLRDYTPGTTTPNPVSVPKNLVTISSIARLSPMTFTASSSNPAVADVTLSGTQLLVNSKTVGTARITVTATDLDGAAVTQQFNVTVVLAPGHLANISTRLQVGTDTNVLIAGFIVRGGTSKRLVVRGIGPSLTSSGITGPLADPIIELHDQASDKIIATNDNWQDAANRQELTDANIAPTANAEAAILTTVPSNDSGVAYTVVLKGVNNTTGIGVVEVYDLDAGPGSSILNISTRGRVEPDPKQLIGGFIVTGTDAKRYLIRSAGPSLAPYGIKDPLADPTLELRDGNGTLKDANDDWQSSPQAAQIQASGAAPTNPKEPAVLDLLAPGVYTAIVRGVNGGVGVATVEVYQQL
ncbi:MAG: peptidylprolyl isomerase [Verrucomicrobiota bacterium]|nr:peptidylprolyl isomerase [Verrucomicrobiota bacterium]